MNIVTEQLSKVYNGIPIIKQFNFYFYSGKTYGICGPNGSGKSTLIKMLCGFLSPSNGKISYHKNKSNFTRSQIFESVSLAAPYCSLIQEYSLEENFNFIRKFKTCRSDIKYSDLIHELGWKNPKEKKFAQFSSGMQQKANIYFALMVNTPLLFLDEPTSYLDKENKHWFMEQLSMHQQNRTVIIASNDEADFINAESIIDLASL